MLSQKLYYSRSYDQDVKNNTIKRWPQDEISILDGNCSPRVNVTLLCLKLTKICKS